MPHLDVRVQDAGAPSVETLESTLDAHRDVRSVALIVEGAPASVSAVELLVDLCQRRRLHLRVDVGLDADADACAALGGQPTSLAPVLQLTRALHGQGVPVRWRVPILNPLSYRLEALFSLAHDEGASAVLAPAGASLPPASSAPALDPESAAFVRDFVACRLLGEEKPGPLLASFYTAVHEWLKNPSEPWPGLPIAATAELAPDERGEWGVRSGLRPAMAGSAPTAGAGRTSLSVSVVRRRDHALEVAGVFVEGIRALAQWAATIGTHGQTAAGGTPACVLRRVLVIGAYGGDHIGDTAIAGGVLLRMHERYRTEDAILVSQRPDHTRRLVGMLDLPVRVTVEEYRQSTIPTLLDQVDAVVFGGGPLMDLPKQLVKHLYAVSRARRAGKPFIVEGIGAGPFVRRVSAVTARLFTRMAERITVRTADDGRAPLVRGLKPIVGRDPAFDYLETRGPVLTHLSPADRAWLDRLLADTDRGVKVAINLRPLRADYTEGSPAGSRAEYTRVVESRFEARLAEAMRRVHEGSADPPCFIFFPMNAIQFGSSDLRSAYRLKRLLQGDVDFRVWQGDPSIDGVIELLRHVDVAITMRFHATIYAVSQRKPVIGIDYRPGKRDKVAALLEDLGQGHNCGRIDEVTTEWLVDRLTELARPFRAPDRRDSAGTNPPRAPRPVPM